jgi:hypothetical protein
MTYLHTKHRLLAGVALALLAGAAQAQTAPAAPAQVQEIEVVGTRIQGAKTVGALPVTVVTSDQIAATGAVTGDDILRTIQIMGRRGLLRPKPASLLGIPLDIEFDSMIAVAQRAAETASMERGMQVVTQLQASYPQQSPADNVDVDQFTRIYLEKANFPVKAMNGEDQVKQIRQGRAQANKEAAAKAQTMQAVTHAAPAAAKAAKRPTHITAGLPTRKTPRTSELEGTFSKTYQIGRVPNGQVNHLLMYGCSVTTRSWPSYMFFWNRKRSRKVYGSAR